MQRATSKYRLWLWIALMLPCCAAIAQGDFSVLSWNIRHFGASKDSTEMAFIAGVIGDYDVAALQEISAGPAGAQAVARLADALNRSGQKWDYALSDPTRSSPYKSERYAVLWKTSIARRCGRPALLYALDSLVQREPFQVCLQCGEKRLLLLNYHASAPDDYPEREIRHIVQSMLQLDGAPVLLSGDFNLPDAHPVFFPLAKKGYRAALQSTPTTLRQAAPKPGQSPYLHPYDNIFFPTNNFTMLESGRIDMVELAGSLEAALRISDHAPVWAILRL